MKSTFMLVITSLLALMACTQTKNDNQVFNLDFEQLNQGYPTERINTYL